MQLPKGLDWVDGQVRTLQGLAACSVPPSPVTSPLNPQEVKDFINLTPEMSSDFDGLQYVGSPLSPTPHQGPVMPVRKPHSPSSGKSCLCAWPTS